MTYRPEKGMEIYYAGLKARDAAEAFFSAHDIREFSEIRSEINRHRAIQELGKAAEILGFKLVQVEAMTTEAANV